MSIRCELHAERLPATLQVVELRVEEGLSRVTDVNVLFRDTSSDVDLGPLVWTEALVEIYDEHVYVDDPDDLRCFHGVIEEAEYVGTETDGPNEWYLYRLRLRPQLHGLSYRIRSRIFQDENAVDVIKRVFTDAGIPEDRVRWSVSDGYPVREYTTQWKESELAFVSRLLEEEGIFYWIEHEQDGHVLFLGDDQNLYQPIAGDPTLSVIEGHRSGGVDAGLYAVSFSTKFTFDSYAARDWEFTTPDLPPEGEASENELAAYQYYEYPGRFTESAVGARHAQDRLAEQVGRRYLLSATTGSRRLAPGRKIQMIDSHPAWLMGEYLVIGASHRWSGGQWRTELAAMPAEQPFRPPRRTPKPSVPGVESAVITGPVGEEIHVDNFGRVKVHFYWDREGAIDDTASCWIRTQQLNTSTTMVLPRVGWEVSVGFLHGDPDRPVVLQKLYNDEQLPPYGLPDNLASSSLQTSSSPGGGGTNEIRTNDTNGAMEFFIHAQKDMSTMVGNNLTEEIGVDAAVQVTADSTRSVTGDESVSIGADQNVSVTGACTTQTVGGQTVSVGGLDDWGVKAIQSVNVAADRTETIGGLMNVLSNTTTEEFKASHSRTVGGAQMIAAGGPIADVAAGNKTELVGGAKLELIKGSKAENVGAAKVLNSGAAKFNTGADLQYSTEGGLAINTGGAFKVKCGGDFAITGSKVTVTVAQLKLDAGGKLTANSSKVKLKGGEVDTSGSNLKLKGTVKYK